MKSSPAVEPAAAFPDPDHVPDDRDLAAVLGAAFAPVAELFSVLRHAHPDVSTTWRFSEKSGWHCIVVLNQRRLFYLVPRRGDFRLSLVVGAKAIASLSRTVPARTLARLLKTTKIYPEGTAFFFDRISCEPAIVAALLEAKLAR